MKICLKRMMQLILAVHVVAALSACNNERSALGADSTNTSGTTAAVVHRTEPAPKITIPAGTRLRVTLLDGVSTSNSAPGDTFSASLSEPVIIEGKMVLEKGTRVRGRVLDVEESGRVKGRARIQLTLTEILRNGNATGIKTKSFTAVAEATKKRDAGIIAGGTGIGAAVGALAGGKKGALIGAGVGGGAGTGTVLATKGKDIRYPAETRLSFTLANPVQI
jgi:hypothetical protein